jgi:hypothetical protein
MTQKRNEEADQAKPGGEKKSQYPDWYVPPELAGGCLIPPFIMLWLLFFPTFFFRVMRELEMDPKFRTSG